MLPLRVDLEPNPTFGELVAQNARLAKEIGQHSEISLAQLAEAVDDKKFATGGGSHPVIQVACIYEGSGEAHRIAHISIKSDSQFRFLLSTYSETQIYLSDTGKLV